MVTGKNDSRRKVAVFGTSAIQRTQPYTVGQLPVHLVEGSGGGMIPVYSSGKLEIALKRGYDVYVVSLLPDAGEEHQWFLRLLPRGHAFFSDQIFEGMNSGELAKLQYATLRPWRRLYDILGVAWVDSFTDPDEARQHLVRTHGVVDGETIGGFASN